MDNQKILLPFNFTPNDHKAIAFVVRTFGGREDVELTVFYAYTPVPKIETQDASVMGKLKGNLNYLSQKVMQQEAELKKVQEKLIQSGFGANRVKTVFKARKKDIAAEIVELAAREHSDVIVINHKPGKATRFFAGTVFSKVVNAVKDITVCIVS